MTDSRQLPRLLTIPEVAEALRVSERQAYRLAELGEFPSVRIGERSVRVAEDDLAQYVEGRRHVVGL